MGNQVTDHEPPPSGSAEPVHIDADRVRQIAAIEDAALRNVWITYAYSELNRRVRAASGFTLDHTWCGFATWASATAGRTIRREDLPAPVVELLDASSRHRAGLAEANSRRRVASWLGVPPVETADVLVALDEALDRASAHVGHGNLLVFAELGPLFVAFAELVERQGRAVDDAAIAATLAATGPVVEELMAAFAWYGRAMAAADPAERARSLLAANVIAVSHEQQLLQDDIAAALGAGLQSLESALDALFDELRRRARLRVTVRLTGKLGAQTLRSVILHAWDVAVTHMMMTLRVPGAELRLAEDVPPGSDGRLFPVDLAVLDGPPAADPNAARVFGLWDRSGGTGRHDRARDWSNLHERMSYIVNLFRSRQQDPSLGEAPLASEQLAELLAGRMPPPPLLPSRHHRDAAPADLA